MVAINAVAPIIKRRDHAQHRSAIPCAAHCALPGCAASSHFARRASGRRGSRTGRPGRASGPAAAAIARTTWSSWPSACTRWMPCRPASVGATGAARPRHREGRAGRSGGHAEGAGHAAPARLPASWSGRASLGVLWRGGLRLRPRLFCISTTSSQRPNFQPAALNTPSVLEPAGAVHAHRAGIGRVADHGQHLARALRAAHCASSSASSRRPTPWPRARSSR